MIILIFIERSATKRFAFVITSEDSSAQLELVKYLPEAYKLTMLVSNRVFKKIRNRHTIYMWNHME